MRVAHSFTFAGMVFLLVVPLKFLDRCMQTREWNSERYSFARIPHSLTRTGGEKKRMREGDE